ncbi:50S ribosomal protein L32 [Prauserella cavernicola]|uniref:Large ribosomal subunit protein bL32 n=1 Tax=Prauserella cavernicola TaxID=2800127 RepID=A0A934QRE3_9PSEU|nr:50S ribosomal protein L32 [Prauserella cavernicola]MBK1786832.1 50S ribosomal protein L32 [Prauserella cavernicola]
MAVPKRKMSRSNTRSRRAQWKAAPVVLVACSNRACRQPKPQHVACPACGQYSGRQVVEPA